MKVLCSYVEFNIKFGLLIHVFQDFDRLEVIGTNNPNPNPKMPERTQSLEKSLIDLEAQRIPEIDEDVLDETE